MAEQNDTDLAHLEWLVKWRSENQNLALTLYKILESNKAALKKDATLENVSQGLVAAVFSLWRAVFLSEETPDHDNTFDHAADFLSIVIQDNAIGYQQDKRLSGWTFFYYVNNARYRLQNIAKYCPDILPAGAVIDRHRKPKNDWMYWHKATEQAVHNLDAMLGS